MDYFKHLPTITYQKNTVKNIMARAILPDHIKKNKSIFYPYTVEDDMRTDTLSQLYYGSPDFSWLVWHTNNIIDPYYSMPLNPTDFYNHIVSKYGSYEYAESTVAFYRNNWYGDSTELTPSDYNNLSDTYKKYWDPVLDYNLQIKSFKRKRDSTTVNTNKIVELEIDYNGNTSIQVGEKVKVGDNIWGWCCFSSNNIIQIQHVTGQFNANTTIVGQTSLANGNITANNILRTTIAGQDTLYWEAVTYLEVEEEENAKRKEIYLLDVTYKDQARSELKRVMSE